LSHYAVLFCENKSQYEVTTCNVYDTDCDETLTNTNKCWVNKVSTCSVNMTVLCKEMNMQ